MLIELNAFNRGPNWRLVMAQGPVPDDLSESPERHPIRSPWVKTCLAVLALALFGLSLLERFMSLGWVWGPVAISGSLVVGAGFYFLAVRRWPR